MVGRPQIYTDDELRVRLDEAATSVFAAKGFAAATLDEIASVACVRKPAIYRLYDSKTALYCSLLQRAANEAATEALAAVEKGVGTSRERIAAMIDAWFAVLESDPVRWRVLHNVRPDNPEIAATVRSIRAMQLANDVALLRAFLPGLGDGEVDALANALHAALIGVGDWWIANPDQPRSIPVRALTRICHGLILTQSE